MEPLRPGTQLPESVGVPGPGAVVVYKVTCPVCQMAAPKFDELAAAHPGSVTAVGQDPEPALAGFRSAYGIRVPTRSDTEPYEASDSLGVRVVPTLFVIDGDGRVADVVESWTREGFNRASRTLSSLLGSETAVVSEEGDGLPAFRPG